MSEYDLVIRGGTVVDDTGAESFRADFAIVGTALPRSVASRVAVAASSTPRGLVVTPGFIDGTSTWTPRSSGTHSGAPCTALSSRVTLNGASGWRVRDIGWFTGEGSDNTRCGIAVVLGRKPQLLSIGIEHAGAISKDQEISHSGLLKNLPLRLSPTFSPASQESGESRSRGLANERTKACRSMTS